MARPGRMLLGWAGIWFLALASLGLYMRAAFIWPVPLGVAFSNYLHAHSHTAYFGWAALGLMGAIYELLPRLTGRPLAKPGAVAWHVRLAPWLVGAALAAYLWQGYGPFSITVATLNQLLWYVFIYVFWQNIRGLRLREWPPALLYLGTAVLYLFVSTLGTWWISVAMAAGIRDPVLKNAGIYLFLHAFGDGWLELGVAGVVLALLPLALGPGQIQATLLRRAVLIQAVLGLPAFLRLLVPFGLKGPLAALGVVTGALLIIPEGMLLAATRQAWLQARRAAAGPARLQARPWLAVAWWALVVKAVLELVPLLPGWLALATERHTTIAYLHLKLLGVFSAALLGCL